MAGLFKHKKKATEVPELQLNSLVDVFTTLIFFLLQLFASGAESVVSKDILLPLSVSQREIVADTVIAITPDQILVEGFSVANIAEEVAKPTELVIPGLKAILTKIKQRANVWQEAGALEAWEGRVIIQGDRDINFEILKRVLFTAGQEGFSLISLAVIKTG